MRPSKLPLSGNGIIIIFQEFTTPIDGHFDLRSTNMTEHWQTGFLTFLLDATRKLRRRRQRCRTTDHLLFFRHRLLWHRRSLVLEFKRNTQQQMNTDLLSLFLQMRILYRHHQLRQTLHWSFQRHSSWIMTSKTTYHRLHRCCLHRR